MITIEINSDTPLTDPRFDILHAAARDIAEATGQMVRIISNVTLAPPSDRDRAEMTKAKFERYQWQNFSDPVLPSIDEEESAQYVGSGAAVKDSLTTDPFAVDWSKAPAHANYHAFDEDSQGYWFSDAPRMGIECFVAAGGGAGPRDYIKSGFYLEDFQNWRGSVTRRPVPCTITTSSLLKDQAS